MEKVSNIIPPSMRQVWVSGEKEKPRRVADPVPGERYFSDMKPATNLPIAPGDLENIGMPNAGVSNDAFKGSKINLVA